MLYFLLSWCLLIGVSLALGAVVFADLAPRFPDRVLDRVVLALWLGAGVTAIVLLLVSFVTPLSPVVGLALFLTVAVRSAVQWRQLWDAIVPTPGFAPIFSHFFKSKQDLNATVLGLGLVFVGLAAWVDRPVVWNDTGYYHASLIQWLGTYGTVPGLSLLFNNLGFTSAWFALATPFNPVMLLGRPLAVTNGFAFLLLLGQWAVGVRSLQQHYLHQNQLHQNQLHQNQARLADYYSVIWGTLLIPIVLFLKPLSEILISPSPDLPVTILVGVIGWVMLLVGDREIQPGDNRDRLIPLMLAVVAVSFKLIALPLLPITLFFALWRQPLRVWLTTGAIAVGGLLPLIAGNLITSGCPLYPGNVLCLNLPWSPSPTAIAEVAQGTHGWTTWYGNPPAGSNAWLWSIGQWWGTSNKEKITAIGIVLGLLSLFVGFGSRVFKRGKSGKLSGQFISGQFMLSQLEHRPELWVGGMGVVGIGFIMVTSPFFRFSAPYILTLLAISGATVWHRFAQNQPQSPSQSPSALGDLGFKNQLPIALALITFTLILHRSTLWMPPPMVFASTWVARSTNGIDYFAPQSGDVPQEKVDHKDMCWNAPIPCAYQIGPSVYLRDRDRGLGGGFVRRRVDVIEERHKPIQ